MTFTRNVIVAVLPGPPERVEFVSSDYNSVLLRVVLPTVGTAPLTQLEVEFFQSDNVAVNLTVPGMDVGASVALTVPDLQDGTEYNISVAVYNYGGKGMPSQLIKVVTSESNS